MKIVWYSGLVNLELQEKEALLAAGVNVSGGKSLEMDEKDPRWPEVQKVIKKFQRSVIPSTRFSQSDLVNSPYINIRANWHNDYPQPDGGEWRELTYDTSGRCQKCGIGSKQKAPFRLKRSPNWGRRSFFSLNWVFGEIFVRKSLWDNVFVGLGIENWPAVLNSTKEIIDTVVQIKATEIVELETEGLSGKICDVCGNAKYALPIGFFPRPKKMVCAPIFKSLQFFGTGAEAYQLVFISPAIYRCIKAFKGLNFGACSLYREDNRLADAAR